jgi:hypothetical protein
MSEPQTIGRVLDSNEMPRVDKHSLVRRSAVPLERLPTGLEFPEGVLNSIADHASCQSGYGCSWRHHLGLPGLCGWAGYSGPHEGPIVQARVRARLGKLTRNRLQ